VGQWMAWGALLRLVRSADRRHLSIAGVLALGAGAALRWLVGRRSSVPPVRATGVAPNLLQEQGAHVRG
jgi:hypothetical protein